jgi:NDP-sugar pyrophosphorylase family protein
MKAMILAAGLGTRLRPLSDDRPKALVEVAGRTMLEIALARLRAAGVREVIVNLHHFAGMILEYLKANDNFGLRIEVSREEVLLDTGGALKQASWFFLENSNRIEEPFLVHNVDVISTIDLGRMLQFHAGQQALATLAVQHRETSRYLLFDEQLQLRGRQSGHDEMPEMVRSSSQSQSQSQPQAQAQSQPQARAFCGIHVISPRLLTMMIEEGAFSIIACYLRLAAQGEKIVCFDADEYVWRDLGTPASVSQATQEIGSVLKVR